MSHELFVYEMSHVCSTCSVGRESQVGETCVEIKRHAYTRRSACVLRCVAVCCSVLQCVAVCCSVAQCGAVCQSVLQRVAVRCRVLQCVTMRCSVLQHVAVKYMSQNAPPCVRVHVYISM